jgi:hypothetical protein
MKRLWLCLPVVVLCLPLLVFLAGASSRTGAVSQPSAAADFSPAEASSPDDPMTELAKEHPIEFLQKCLARYDKEVQGYDCILQSTNESAGLCNRRK